MSLRGHVDPWSCRCDSFHDSDGLTQRRELHLRFLGVPWDRTTSVLDELPNTRWPGVVTFTAAADPVGPAIVARRSGEGHGRRVVLAVRLRGEGDHHLGAVRGREGVRVVGCVGNDLRLENFLATISWILADVTALPTTHSS